MAPFNLGNWMRSVSIGKYFLKQQEDRKRASEQSGPWVPGKRKLFQNFFDSYAPNDRPNEQDDKSPKKRR